MSDFETAVRIAGSRESGAKCPVCQSAIAYETPVYVCPSCGTAHHEECWRKEGRCAGYECAPPRQELLPGAVPALRITAEEVAAVRPLQAASYGGQRWSPSVSGAPKRPTTSRLAIAAFVTGIAGIPFFGLFTGLVAIVMGSMALGTIRSGAKRGLAWAAAGLLLGLADVAGWAVVLAVFFLGKAPDVYLNDFQPDLASFADLDPKIGRAMRSNVMIRGTAGMSLHIGSGVILRIKDGWADVLTNRHVVDPDFKAEPPGVRAGTASGDLTVQLVGQSACEGTVTWLAPQGVDLAVVRVACSSPEARSAWWEPKTALKVGDPVFAIGNPHGLGWTHTQGTISQFRLKDDGGRRLRIIQMQTAVNPGNSGGGLYDSRGVLVGIVTWSQDKRVSEGLNFAIALESALPLLPGDLAAPPTTKD